MQSWRRVPTQRVAYHGMASRCGWRGSTLESRYRAIKTLERVGGAIYSGGVESGDPAGDRARV